jgi:hypothetical protein
MGQQETSDKDYLPAVDLSNLQPDQRSIVETMLREESDVFSKTAGDICQRSRDANPI